jgi:hypothetical protein
VAVVVLVAAPTASAHVRSGTVATDFRASLAALPASLRHLIAARIYDSDRAVRLSVAPGHTAVILGYVGEPFVRVSAARGVEVDASAPTAGGTGLLAHVPVHSGGWLKLAGGRAVTWHDSRLRALPPGVDRKTWTIPLVVDGRPAQLRGEIWRVDTPEAVRGIAGAALGILCLAGAAVNFPILLHGVVLSLFPAAAARALVALTLWSGAAAVVLGMVVFKDSLSPSAGLSRA